MKEGRVAGRLDVRLARLERLLREMGTVAVALSGGVDSSFLAAFACHVLGDDAVAVTGVSDSLAARELADAERVARLTGLRLERISTRELENPRYVRNAVDRCYFCKSELYEQIGAWAAANGVAHVVDGLNADDDIDDRPGVRAAHERGVRSPLREAGLTKDDVRAVSREMGLPTADKPAAPCLASRLPHGSAVTSERLQQVERAEEALRALGFDDLRVRHHGPAARVELNAAEDVSRALRRRDDLVTAVRTAGFATVLLDLDGRSSGGADRTAARVLDLTADAVRA